MIASNHTTAATVLHGDCRKLLPTLGKFEFIFADPPFNIGHGYNGYHDRREDFEPFTEEWIAACWEACDGVLALHGPDELMLPYLLAERRLGMRRIAWVNWHYRFGQNNKSNWTDARCHCLIFAKHKKHTWNVDAVRVDSDRKSNYSDKRIYKSKSGGRRPPGTVWGVPSDGPYWGRITGEHSNHERRPGHPNQLPEVYLERLILAYTNAGDRVLDPFGGSGTTAVVAEALGRSCVTCDVSEHNVASIRDRLAKGAVRVARRVATGHPD